MNKVEELIYKEFKQFAENFRPTFGNLEHIRIAEEMGKLGKMEKELSKKIEATAGLKELRDEIRKQRRQILFLFKNQ